MSVKILFTLSICLVCSSMTSSASWPKANAAGSLKEGTWRGIILNDSNKAVPFLFSSGMSGAKTSLTIINASERLKVDEVVFNKDSVIITLPFFDSEIRGRISGEGQIISGSWVRHLPNKDVSLPFYAAYGTQDRFEGKLDALQNATGKWVIKYPEREQVSVGEFAQTNDGKVTGSILNVSGDDRFLEGRVSADSMFLSSFDGSHLILIAAKIDKDGKTMKGKYYSGKSAVRSFSATFDPNAQLPDAYALTYLKKGHKKLDFSFKDTKGDVVSLSDPRYKGKVVVIQFMGSWCPNCMDETAFMSDFYKKNPGKFEVIGLAYERSKSYARSQASLKRFMDRFGVPYEVLITGYTNDNAEVLASMPALNNFMAFPTTAFVDKQGNVVKIHTGFSGPATGKYYTEFVEEFAKTINDLNAK